MTLGSIARNRQRQPRAGLIAATLLLQGRVVIAADTPGAAAVATENSDDRASLLFQSGREGMKKGDYVAACRDFAESQRLDPSSGTLLNLAVCEERLGHILHARDLVREFVRSSSPTDDRGPRALALAANLDERIPTLVLEFSSTAPKDAKVSLDDEELPSEKWSAPISVEPGEHRLIFEAPGYVAAHRTLILKEGEKAKWVVRLQPIVNVHSVEKPSSTPSGTLPEASPRAMSLPFVVAAAVGAAGLAAAAASGAMVWVNQRRVDDHCIDKRCDADGLAAGDRGRLWMNVNTATLPIGLVGTALAAYLFWSDRPSIPPAKAVGFSMTPSSASVSLGGTF